MEIHIEPHRTKYGFNHQQHQQKKIQLKQLNLKHYQMNGHNSQANVNAKLDEYKQ